MNDRCTETTLGACWLVTLMNKQGAWVKIGRVKRGDLPVSVRKKLPKGRSYQIAAFIPSDPEVQDDIAESPPWLEMDALRVGRGEPPGHPDDPNRPPGAQF